MELKFALGFGAVLALVALACARALIGEQALIGVALISGIADVDAVTISLSRLGHTDVALPIALHGIVLAAASNNIAKGVMATLVGGINIGLRVGVPLVATTIAGLAVLALR